MLHRIATCFITNPTEYRLECNLHSIESTQAKEVASSPLRAFTSVSPAGFEGIHNTHRYVRTGTSVHAGAAMRCKRVLKFLHCLISAFWS